MKAWTLLLFAPALAAALPVRRETPAPAVPAKPEPVHVVLQTDWYAEPEHGGFYQALAKGWYGEAGLDVEIREGSPSTVPAQIVATGRADFAIGSSTDVILAAGRGIPFVMIGAYMQRDPQGIMHRHGDGIRSFRDLNGRNIMAVPGAPFLQVLERMYGINISVTPADFGMERFMADKSLIQQCFVTNEPYYVRREGVDADVLLISDCGFSPYRVLYARRTFADAHPGLVRAFEAESMRGWLDFIGGDPSPANVRIAALNSRMDAGFMAYSREAMRRHRLVTGDPAQGERPGRIDPERIHTLIGQLWSAGLLDRRVEVREVLDAQFSAPGYSSMTAGTNGAPTAGR